MTNLQSYMKKVSKDYTYEIQLESPVKSSVLEKKLVDFGVSSVQENKKSPGHYKLSLSYPIAGQELLTRLCENSKNLIKVYDAEGQVYSNHPIEPIELEESVEEVAPVIDMKKTTVFSANIKESREELANSVAAIVTESLSKDFENIINKLSEDRAVSSIPPTSNEAIDNIIENIAQLKESLDRLTNDIAAINDVVNDALGSYSKKLVELTEANNKLNHKVKKTILRDANGFITEVTEQIIPEK